MHIFQERLISISRLVWDACELVGRYSLVG